MSLRCGNLSLGFLRKLSFASASCRSAPLLDMAGRVMRDAPQPWACDCDTSFLGLPSFGWNSSANRSNLSALHQDKRHHANGVETALAIRRHPEVNRWRIADVFAVLGTPRCREPLQGSRKETLFHGRLPTRADLLLIASRGVQRTDPRKVGVKGEGRVKTYFFGGHIQTHTHTIIPQKSNEPHRHHRHHRHHQHHCHHHHHPPI